jgi:GUN4-like
MIVTFHQQNPGAELPRQRVKLYQEICELQLKKRPSARKLETLLLDCDAQTILQMLALEMMNDPREESDRSAIIEQTVLLNRLTGYLQHLDEKVDAKVLLKQVVEISELLVKRQAEDEYEFSHLSFQEYLAAVQIDQQKQETVLYEHFKDDSWRQTIVLYAALTRNPTRLITEIMRQGAVDLAYSCWQATSKSVDAELVQTIKSSRFGRLEEYLKKQEWVNADYETYRLMITTVGKDEGQFFTSAAELLNFPCEELKKIDRLWRQYSNDHFGFSVQKQIYVECGGKLDGKYPSMETWRSFGDVVGWREKGEWMNYSAFTKEISLSAHQGKFPWLLGGWVGSGGVVVVVLFSRTETCEL